MSTWIYLECQDHDPPIESSTEVGQHLHDLPRIRSDLADRDTLATYADMREPSSWAGPMDDYWRRSAAQFLRHHPECRIGIRDEYGEEHPLEEA